MLGAHQHLGELAESLPWKGLGEDVGDHVLGLDVADSDAPAFDLLADVVVRDVDVLGGRSVAGVVALRDAALAVAPERDGWPRQAELDGQISRGTRTRGRRLHRSRTCCGWYWW